jgi:hypothetical protein
MAKKNKAKKAYKKPTVTQVKLEIGEAVLGACKVDVNDLSTKTARGSCGASSCKSYYAES